MYAFLYTPPLLLSVPVAKISAISVFACSIGSRPRTWSDRQRIFWKRPSTPYKKRTSLAILTHLDTGKDFNSSEIVRWSYDLILHDIFISVILLAEKSRIYE